MSGRSWLRASLLGLGLLGVGGVLAGRGQVKPADAEGAPAPACIWSRRNSRSRSGSIAR